MQQTEPSFVSLFQLLMLVPFTVYIAYRCTSQGLRAGALLLSAIVWLLALHIPVEYARAVDREASERPRNICASAVPGEPMKSFLQRANHIHDQPGKVRWKQLQTASSKDGPTVFLYRGFGLRTHTCTVVATDQKLATAIFESKSP
jgi:hypothetical protein